MEDSLFSIVYENAPVAMLIVDEDVKVQSANKAALELISVPMEGAMNVRAGAVFGCLNSYDDPNGCGFGPLCKQCTIRGSVTSTMSTGASVKRAEASIPLGVGDRQVRLSLLVSTSRIRWGDRPLVLLCMENITDLAAAQDSLRRANEHMQVLASIVRHDLRGNLLSVSASIELAKEKAAKNLDSADIKRLDHAVAVIQKSAELLDTMRELEKVVTTGTSAALKPVDLRKTAESVLEKYILEKSVIGDATALGDDALASAVDNIVSNAIQHGKATKIEVTIFDGHDRVVLRIADNGSGVDEAIRNKLFEKGFTTGGASHHGLGLYIAKAVVEQYGGTIRVEENRPRGAAFVIELAKSKKAAS